MGTTGFRTFSFASALALGTLCPAASAQAVDDSCRQSDACHEDGRCSSSNGRCVAASGFDCVGSDGCRIDGRCTALAGRCVAATPADCRGSMRCVDDGLCHVDVEGGRCDRGMRRENKPLMIGGTVLAATGGAAVVAGGVLTMLTHFLCEGMGPAGDEGKTCRYEIGLGVMGGGAALALGVGLPMAVSGGAQVPREDRAAVPMSVVGPTGGTLTWSF